MNVRMICLYSVSLECRWRVLGIERGYFMLVRVPTERLWFDVLEGLW